MTLNNNQEDSTDDDLIYLALGIKKPHCFYCKKPMNMETMTEDNMAVIFYDNCVLES